MDNPSWPPRIDTRLCYDCPCTFGSRMIAQKYQITGQSWQSNCTKNLLIHRNCGESAGCLNQQIIKVKNGEAWGAIHVPANFSQVLDTGNSWRIYLDGSSPQVTLTILEQVNRALEEFRLCRGDQDSLPFVFDPVYGGENTTFTDFMAPGDAISQFFWCTKCQSKPFPFLGVILTAIFFLAIGLTSSAYTIERQFGLLRRR